MRKLLVNVFFFLLVPIFVESLNPSLNDDVLGLIVFKSDVQDPNEKLTSWNEEDDSPCNWKGIKCNPRSNRVSEVVLDGFGLSGKISRGLLRLQLLRKLSLANNNLTGSISSLSLAQLHNLKILDLSANTLSGPIPPDYFQQCGPLRSISFANNQFSGQIPESLSSCVTLASLNLSSNQFSGLVPSGVWSLNGLRSLDLSKNFLDGEIPVVIQGLSNLRAVNLGRNRFKGEIPDEIGGCLLLRSIDLSENAFSGELPSTMHKFSLCNEFILRSNAFVGILPEWIGEMKSLEILDFSGNAFSGQVPASVRKLELLKVLNLSQNEISGSFPESMSTCVSLFALDVSHNSLTGTIPETVSQLKSLEILDLSENRLNGSIPAGIGGLTSLRELRLAKNALEGEIPRLIGNCSSLASLSLSHNALTGPVPADLAKLTYLQKVDFSFNKLTGMLPKQLGDLGHLLSFNISHNQLRGELPSNGFFNTISPYSVSANPSICGAAVNRSCSTVMPKPIVLNPNSTDSTSPTTIGQTFRHEKKILSISALIAIGAAAIIFVGVIAITVLNIRVRSAMPPHRSAALAFSGGDDFSPSPSTDANSGKLVMFSGDPDFSTGAHALLNKDCELGRGGFGAVYHTLLKDGHAVAIKKLTVSSLVKSQEDFEREVRKLGKVGHHNLVSLEGYYWTPSLQLLIYEFVGGGNLYKHLHEGCGLSWNKRFNILVGTAKGMAHLHEMNIIHYNLKSSNILIDSSSGEAKVADYGLARLLPMLDRYVLSSKIQSALGYMAPEFACKTVKITEKCDVYGFGVVILEVVTGKRPVEYMEDDVVVLCDMVRGALEEGRIEDCVDERLQGKFAAEEAIPVIKLGLICTSQVPSNRPDMAQVVNILELIRCPDELV